MTSSRRAQALAILSALAAALAAVAFGMGHVLPAAALSIAVLILANRVLDELDDKK